MRRSLVWYILALLLVGLLAAACTPAAGPAVEGGAAAPEAGAEGLTLRVEHDLRTVHTRSRSGPRLLLDTPIEQMFLGLTNLNNETSEVEPELAESWTVSDDGLVWTFNLRQDAVWSDGNPVTAKDVEYSVKRAVMPETASPYAYVLYVIKNAAPINQTQIPTDTYDMHRLGVKALDDYTVEFTLEAPAAYFESISSMWTLRPVPRWAIEEYGDAWTEPENMSSTGPQDHRMAPSDKLIFEKNPDYYAADEVQIDKVDLSVITDQFTTVAL